MSRTAAAGLAPALALDSGGAGTPGPRGARPGPAGGSLARWRLPSTGCSTRSCARRRRSPSQIQGTQATLVDLLTFEADASGNADRELDVEEVTNYLDASSTPCVR